MTARGIVIVGTGGSARETLVVLRDIERHAPGTWAFQGFVATDPPRTEVLDRISAPFLGHPLSLAERSPAAHGWCFVTGIGDPRHRRAMDSALSAQGLEPATLIHPTSLLGGDVAVGEGSVVCAYSVLTTNVQIGQSAQINIGCVIGHDARIGSYVTTAQSVNVAGDVTIDDDVTLHTQALINRGLRIGRGAIIGSGAVVIRDVEATTTVVGVPARPIR